jgi:hypothetical protein
VRLLFVVWVCLLLVAHLHYLVHLGRFLLSYFLVVFRLVHIHFFVVQEKTIVLASIKHSIERFLVIKPYKCVATTLSIFFDFKLFDFATNILEKLLKSLFCLLIAEILQVDFVLFLDCLWHCLLINRLLNSWNRLLSKNK